MRDMFADSRMAHSLLCREKTNDGFTAQFAAIDFVVRYIPESEVGIWLHLSMVRPSRSLNLTELKSRYAAGATNTMRCSKPLTATPWSRTPAPGSSKSPSYRTTEPGWNGLPALRATWMVRGLRYGPGCGSTARPLGHEDPRERCDWVAGAAIGAASSARA